MQAGRAATILFDESLMRGSPPLIELESLAGKAVALLACRAEAISATIFRKPLAASYWISLCDGKRNMRGLYELKPQAPVVDFEVCPRAVSDLVSTG
jgi:hypothetical protein